MKTRHLLLVVTLLSGCLISGQAGVAGTLQIVHSIDFPGGALLGYDLAWDGQYLWTSMIPGDTPLGEADLSIATYALDPSDGTVVSLFVAEGVPNARGHTWDGSHLWITSFLMDLEGSPPDTVPDYVYKLGSDGTVIDSFVAPGSPDAMPTGAAWDGRSLWLSDGRRREIVQVDPVDGSVIASFTSPGTAPLGLTWDGSSLWSVDGIDDVIYQMDTSGNVLETWSLTGIDPHGITFDGEYFWVLDNVAGKISQLVVPEPPTFTLSVMCAITLLALVRWRRVLTRVLQQKKGQNCLLPTKQFCPVFCSLILLKEKER